jgi:hypothetical protein
VDEFNLCYLVPFPTRLAELLFFAEAWAFDATADVI